MDIEINNLSVSFGASRVLRGANLSLRQGEITALVGESGSGKSILGAAVMGLLPAEAVVSGHIFYGGKDLLSLADAEMEAVRGKEIGWIAQDPISAMDPLYPVGRQVMERERFDHPAGRKEERKRGIFQLFRFGLPQAEEVYDMKPHELSGGMAQRVMAAMMAMPRPSWLIADEPTKGLDAFVRREVCDVFRKLKEEGIGFLLITHDLRLAERLADETVIIYAGEIVEKGPTKEIFSHPFHPYTVSFFDASPRRFLRPIPGAPPDLSMLSGGCIFKERCPYTVCEGKAEGREIFGHWVKCHHGERR